MKFFFIFFLILVFLTAIPLAVASYDTVTIDGVTFDIPSQYQNGRSFDGGYVFDNFNVFGIQSLSSSLSNVYGYDMKNAYSENTTIGSHDIVYCYKYNPTSETNNSAVYFSCNDTIYSISFEGNTIPDYVREMVENSPESTLSSEEFYSILDNALDQYNMEKMVDDYVGSHHYYSHSGDEKSSDIHFFYYPRFH